MNLRTKLLLIFIGGSLLPVLLVGFIFYRNSARALEGILREDVQAQTARIADEVESRLRERERELEQLAASNALRAYVRQETGAKAATDGSGAVAGRAEAGINAPPPGLPEDVQSALGGFISQQREQYAALTFVSATPNILPVRFAPPAPGSASPRVKTGDRLPDQTRVDERIWSATEHRALRSNDIGRISTGMPGLVYTVPVFAPDTERAPRGALIAELKIDALLQEAGHSLSAATPAASAPATVQSARLLIALDAAGQVVYHSNDALKYQSSAAAMPYFDEVAREMQAGRSGASSYRTPMDGARWLVAYQPVSGLHLAVAVAGNYTRTVGSLQRGALIVSGLSLLIALVSGCLLYTILTRTTRRIERVTAAAAAIASGDLNQRVETRAHDETHALAENFNRMSDRLREQIAHEAETRQFQSFVRLSAMLTHDLKNSITGLSMLVTNMERQFHRAEFRADAISSLKQATEKLSALVARLSEPMRTLSGEYRLTPQFNDLVTVINRALATTAEPSAAFYEIVSELPETLPAPVDAERIERVVENLIVNAFEAMGGRGGRLTVAAGRESESLVFFSVADTGIGMSDEFVRTRLFRAFATTKKHGIGLGLYTCREIVEAHGGRLEVKSVQGSGTRFRVVLPSTPFQQTARMRSSGKSFAQETNTGTDSAG